MTLVWIAVALLFAIGEVVTLALFAGFVALGALGAAIAAFTEFSVAGSEYLGQAIVFGAVSLFGIAAVRRPLIDYLQRRSSPELISGAAAMIGQTALLVDPIGGPHQRGHVRIAGEDWPALTTDGRPLEAGQSVRVVDIRRATLVVERTSGAVTQQH